MAQKTAIQRAVEAAGTAYQLAKMLGLEDPNQAYKWVRNGYAPPGWYAQIEELTGVSRLDLLNDYPQK